MHWLTEPEAMSGWLGWPTNEVTLPLAVLTVRNGCSKPVRMSHLQSTPRGRESDDRSNGPRHPLADQVRADRRKPSSRSVLHDHRVLRARRVPLVD